jgi:hypothetical protein
MRSVSKAIVLFFAMYLIATVLGFATYLFISPLAMWVSVFTVMPVVSALLVFWYLIQIRCGLKDGLREAMIVVAIWIALSFTLDAVTYIFIVPFVAHNQRNWTFFIDQSPWIWLSYAVLFSSGAAANWLYRCHRQREEA